MKKKLIFKINLDSKTCARGWIIWLNKVLLGNLNSEILIYQGKEKARIKQIAHKRLE